MKAVRQLKLIVEDVIGTLKIFASGDSLFTKYNYLWFMMTVSLRGAGEHGVGSNSKKIES